MSQDGGQDVTLMFADVSVAVSQAGGEAVPRSLEEVEHCLSLLGAIQKQHGGKFTREVGNTLVCCFDAPEEGVGAACEMQQAVSVEGTEGAPLSGLRIALHAGKPIMRNGVCAGELMTTAARLVTVALPGQIIVTDRVAEGLGPQADVQVAAAPNASSMEKRLHVRLSQICWGGGTLAAGTPKMSTKRCERQRVLGTDEEERSPSLAVDSGDSNPQGGVQASPSGSTEAGVDIDPEATEVFDISAILAEDTPAQRESGATDGLVSAKAQRGADEAATGGGSSPRATTFCLIWRGQVLSIRNEEDVIHLGREEENEVVLDCDMASRLHAHVERRGATFVLVDYSTNGTYVYDSEGNQKRVRDDEAVLDASGALSPGCPQDAPGSTPILFWTAGGGPRGD